MAQIIPVPFKMLSAEIFIQGVEHYKEVSMLFVLFCLWVMADQIDLLLWPSNCNMHKLHLLYTQVLPVKGERKLFHMVWGNFLMQA